MIERCVRTHCPDLQAMSGRPQWRAGAAGESRPKELPKGAFSSWPHHHASRRGVIARLASSRPRRRVGCPLTSTPLLSRLRIDFVQQPDQNSQKTAVRKLQQQMHAQQRHNDRGDNRESD